jgi:arsenate reductase (thioredoxin)
LLGNNENRYEATRAVSLHRQLGALADGRRPAACTRRRAFEVFSAGIKPSTVNPLAIAAMDERGIDIRSQRSKHLNEYLDQRFDYVITVCDNVAETCPIFPGPARRIHWSFPDPAGVVGSEAERLAAFRQVRDALEAQLRSWLATDVAELSLKGA